MLNGCQKQDAPVRKYSAEDLLGTWIYVLEDNTPLTSREVAVETFNADGTVTYKYVEENQWVERASTYAVIDNVIRIYRDGQVHLFDIVNIDKLTMVIRSKETKAISTAQFVRTTENTQIYGTWMCEEFRTEGIALPDYQVTFGEDGEYIVSYQGGTPVTGEYKVLNNFLLYQSNRAGAMILEMSRDEQGVVLNQVYADADGTIHKNATRRKPMATFTLADASGIWLTTSCDGAPIDLQEASICVAGDNGHSVISYIENNTWSSHNVVLTTENNILYRVIDGVEDASAILYFDRNTIIWKNLQDGSVITRTKILPKDDLKEYVKGMWRNSEASILFREDSLRYTPTLGEPVEVAYKLYGDILVEYTDTQCKLFRFFSGYDSQADRPTLNIRHMGNDGQRHTAIFNKVDLLKDLDGAWIWRLDNGQPVATNDLKITFYHSGTGMDDYMTFHNGVYNRVVESFYVSKGTIYYPENTANPFEKVLNVSANTLQVISSDGHNYMAFRIPFPSPLEQPIIGEWNCASFNDGTSVTENFTHVFDANGCVTVKKEGTTVVVGSYRIYGRLVVMLFKGTDGVIKPALWVIKDGQIGDTMTFYQRLSDGSIIENLLTKVITE